MPWSAGYITSTILRLAWYQARRSNAVAARRAMSIRRMSTKNPAAAKKEAAWLQTVRIYLQQGRQARSPLSRPVRDRGPPRLLDGGDGSPQPAHGVFLTDFGCFGHGWKNKPEAPHIREIVSPAPRRKHAVSEPDIGIDVARKDHARP